MEFLLALILPAVMVGSYLACQHPQPKPQPQKIEVPKQNLRL